MGVQATVRVVGMTFYPGYPENVHRLAELLDEWTVRSIRDADSFGSTGTPETPAAVLIRRPDNAHDPNAIEVHVPVLGADAMLGYVPADAAMRWAPKMDAGQVVQAWVTAIPVNPDHLERPAVEILVRVHDQDCAVGDPADPECTCSRAGRQRPPISYSPYL
jgi:hypothetical protein